MKAILISIKPKYVALEMNGDKTIEVRNTAPKDWKDYLSGKTKETPKPIDVYIYCTKDREILGKILNIWTVLKRSKWVNSKYNGKVVAKFTLNKVEEIRFDDKEVQRKACLTEDELFDYLFVNEPHHEDMKKGYGWHISNLEIFDTPKELGEFYITHITIDVGKKIRTPLMYPRRLTKAPQSWCYVEDLL